MRMRLGWIAAAAGFVAIAAIASCSDPTSEAPPSPPSAPAGSQAEAQLPAPLLPPSFDDPGRVIFATGLDGTELADVEACGGCHPGAIEAWRGSAHAHASLVNPIYQASFVAFVDAAGENAARFCAGCHDVPLLADDAVRTDIAPTDPRSRAGVGCRVCHGMVEASPDHNGAFELAAIDTEFDANDPDEVAAHKAEVMRDELSQAAVCASCHRAFLGPHTGHPHHLPGMDDVTPFRRSAYAGSQLDRVEDDVPEQTCVSCHMPRVKAPAEEVARDAHGELASHRFAGGNTYLAAMRGDEEQLDATVGMLRKAVTIDIAAARQGADRALPAETLELVAGEPLELDVVVRNVGAGHHFPGGTRDSQDTWLSVRVFHGETLVAQSGTDPDDANAHRFQAGVADEEGMLLLAREIADFRTTVFDHTIAPRDAAVIRYLTREPLPAGDAPIRVEAELLHRARPEPMAALACVMGERAGLDPCVAQPVTSIASVALTFTPDHRAPAHAWRRLLDHAIGLSHSVQERRGEAEQSALAALALLGDGAFPSAKAEALSLLGRTAAAQGRTNDALAYYDQAEALVGRRPAFDFGRGVALTRVWRFDEAAVHLARAASDAPLDDRAAAELAMTLGSLGRDREALEIARAALALYPRHPDLLRSQALASRSLTSSRETQDATLAAFLSHRRQDDAPAVKNRCRERSPQCRLERTPVHTHVLVPIAP